jgi:hypothetical protein
MNGDKLDLTASLRLPSRFIELFVLLPHLLSENACTEDGIHFPLFF